MSTGEPTSQSEASEPWRASHHVSHIPGVVDVAAKPRSIERSVVTRLLVTLLLIGPGLILIHLSGLRLHSLVLLTFPLAGVIGHLVEDWRASRIAVRQVRESSKCREWREMYESAALPYLARPARSLWREPVLCALARHLASRGVCGDIIRITIDFQRRTSLGVPLQERIEPVLLSRWNGQLPDAPDAPLGGRQDAGLLPRGIATVRGPWGQATLAAVFSISISVLLWGLYCFVFGIPGAMHGTALVLATVFAGTTLPSLLLHRREEWFAVPGAIVVRTASLWSSQWRVDVLPKTESTLVFLTDHSIVAIANQDGAAFARTMTPYEITFALRAFRSDLPPPTLEQLSDLK